MYLSLTWVALLAIGGLFFAVVVVLALVVVAVIVKTSNRGIGFKGTHPDVAACTQCGFVAPRGKIQCPSCGCKVGELVSG